MDLPNDPMMLLSVVNTKLRDFYTNLDELCDDLGAEKQDIVDKLRMLGYEYDEKLNKFI